MGYRDMMNTAMARRRRPATATATDFNDRGSLAAAEGGAYGAASGYGAQANANYYGQLAGFNASDSINQYAKGAFGSVSEGLKQTLANLKGQSVGAGRFDSGYFDEDQGTVVRNVMNDFSNNLSQQAVAAAGMQQRNTAAIGQFGAEQQGIGNDLLVSRREELENNAREEEERKRKKRAGIGSAIGGVIGGVGGFLAGGPAGAMGGYQAGSAIGGAF